MTGNILDKVNTEDDDNCTSSTRGSCLLTCWFVLCCVTVRSGVDTDSD